MICAVMYLVVIYPINNRIFPGEKTVSILVIKKSLKHCMARNFGCARAVNIQTLENFKQYGYIKLYM